MLLNGSMLLQVALVTVIIDLMILLIAFIRLLSDLMVLLIGLMMLIHRVGGATCLLI